jgi:polar amino acid transport system substrate-binding protein
MTGAAFRSLLLCLIALMGSPLPLAAQDPGPSNGAANANEEQPLMPRFRHTDVGGKPQSFVRETVIVLADEDFPPFSYAGPEGEPKGIAIDAAQAACQELRTKCQIVLQSWESLSGELTGASNVVAGLRMDEKTLARFQPTRPIYRTVGRFVVRKESELTQANPELIAGKRVGVRAGSGYEAWLKKNFPDALIVPYPSLNELQEALRTAKVEILFGDGLQLVYWMRGGASQECCKYVDGAFFDDASFSRPYVFLIRRGDDELKQAFDYALDQLQETGAFAKIFARYVPGQFW